MLSPKLQQTQVATQNEYLPKLQHLPKLQRPTCSVSPNCSALGHEGRILGLGLPFLQRLVPHKFFLPKCAMRFTKVEKSTLRRVLASLQGVLRWLLPAFFCGLNCSDSFFLEVILVGTNVVTAVLFAMTGFSAVFAASARQTARSL